jgi:zinc transport system substrate-binding protein
MRMRTGGKRPRPAIAIAAAAAALLLTAGFALSGCGRGGDRAGDGKLNVVTTFYPLYYMAEQIGGDDAHVVNLIPAGVEPHDWTPKSRDLQTVEQAGLLLYNGAGLEGWMDTFLKGLGSGWNRGEKAVEASKGIDLIRTDAAPGQEGTIGVDPHTWVSPKSALVMAKNIRDAFVRADPAHQDGYDARYKDLSASLSALDAEYAERLAPYRGRDIVVSHQAFGYLCRDYGLNQQAIMGLSPEAEPRAQDLLKLAQFVKERGIRYIFFEELVSDELAQTLASETGARTMVLHSLEGLTPEQERQGETYLTLMRQNLQNLTKALQ